MTDSNQFFKNKIRNISINKEIIPTIQSWVGRIYTKNSCNYKMLSCKKLSINEMQDFCDLKNCDDYEIYELETCQVGGFSRFMQIVLYKNDLYKYHSIFY